LPGLSSAGIVTKHTALTDKEVEGVIDHADESVSDKKLASGVGLSDGQICKLPTAVADKVLKRGATAWEAGDVPAGIANVAIGYFEQGDATDRVITGLGFRPKIVIFFNAGTGGTQEIFSSGFDNGTLAMCIYKRGHESVCANSYTRSILSMVDAANYLMGSISAISDDGFTVSWDLLGSAWVYVEYLAMK